MAEDQKVKKKVVKKTVAKVSKTSDAPKGAGSGKLERRRARKGKYDIGLDVAEPKTKCSDIDCPFHGTLSVRGHTMKGIVKTDKASKTSVVIVERLHFVKKYQRYEKRTSRFSVHNPPCISAKKGEEVTVAECRPLSKTVSFVIVEKGAEGPTK